MRIADIKRALKISDNLQAANDTKKCTRKVRRLSDILTSESGKEDFGRQEEVIRDELRGHAINTDLGDYSLTLGTLQEIEKEAKSGNKSD